MTNERDQDLKSWAADWQAAPYNVESAEQIRHYVRKFLPDMLGGRLHLWL